MAACGFDCDDSIVRIRVFGCQCVNERAERVVFFFFACIACVTCWARANCMEVPIWVIYCCLKSNDTLENAKKVVMIGGKMCFISEYCECGSLDKLHRVKDLASPKRFLRVVDDVCSGLIHLHRHSILHRDLACRNLLMKRDGTVTLCDFGLSKKLLEDAGYYNNGDLRKLPWPWTDPHSMYTGRFDYKSDVWSLGVTFWEILTKGGDPYVEERKTMQLVRLIDEIRHGRLQLKLPRDCHQEGRTVVNACLCLDRKKRPTAYQIRELAKTIYTNHYGRRVNLEELV
mmetsp:Transcript_1612/g.3102  ORF Transcript_1612/g.3102 Transcript_1612/m.3102 type:complete len:286 (+) Transcript_1612:1334-2191(+)